MAYCIEVRNGDAWELKDQAHSKLTEEKANARRTQLIDEGDCAAAPCNMRPRQCRYMLETHTLWKTPHRQEHHLRNGSWPSSHTWPPAQFARRFCRKRLVGRTVRVFQCGASRSDPARHSTSHGRESLRAGPIPHPALHFSRHGVVFNGAAGIAAAVRAASISANKSFELCTDDKPVWFGR